MDLFNNAIRYLVPKVVRKTVVKRCFWLKLKQLLLDKIFYTVIFMLLNLCGLFQTKAFGNVMCDT